MATKKQAEHVVVALLRAVNVGGTGKLAMEDLRRICGELGFRDARTYIQSGNVVFRTTMGAARAGTALADALGSHMGRAPAVLVRTAEELQDVVDQLPFADADPARVLVMFLPRAPVAAELPSVRTPGGEQLHLRGRELVIHFPDGMGKSKLKVPFAEEGTGRNLNTTRKLLEMALEA